LLIALGASAQEASTNLGTVAKLTDALRTVGADIETSAKVVQLGTSIFSDFGVTAEDVGNKIAFISDSSAVASSTGLQEFLQLFSKAGGLAAQLGVGLDELLASFASGLSQRLGDRGVQSGEFLASIAVSLNDHILNLLLRFVAHPDLRKRQKSPDSNLHSRSGLFSKLVWPCGAF